MSTSDEWVTATVAQCLSPARAALPGIPTTEYRNTGEFPIIDQGAKQVAGWTDDASAVNFEGLPVVVFGDHTRTLKYIESPFARGADGTQVLRPTGEVDPLYFYFACRAIDLPSRGYNRHFSQLREHEIRFPRSIEHQRSIAQALAHVERVAEVHESLVALDVELVDSVREAVFRRGLRGVGSVDSAIGRIPVGWTARSLGEVCEILSGGTPRKSVSDYWDGDIPWASGKDLKSPRIADAIDHITAMAVEDGAKLAPAETVLLLVRGMGLAKDLPVATIAREMAFNQDIKALIAGDGLSGQFLREAIYAGKDRLLSQIVPSAHGTMTLNLTDVESMLIACPDHSEEADEVVELFVAMEVALSGHRKKLGLSRELFGSLLPQLTTGELTIDQLDLSALPALEVAKREVLA